MSRKFQWLAILLIVSFMLLPSAPHVAAEGLPPAQAGTPAATQAAPTGTLRVEVYNDLDNDGVLSAADTLFSGEATVVAGTSSFAIAGGRGKTALPAGTYTVTVTAPNLGTVAVANVTVPAGGQATSRVLVSNDRLALPRTAAPTGAPAIEAGDVVTITMETPAEVVEGQTFRVTILAASNIDYGSPIDFQAYHSMGLGDSEVHFSPWWDNAAPSLAFEMVSSYTNQYYDSRPEPMWADFVARSCTAADRLVGYKYDHFWARIMERAIPHTVESNVLVRCPIVPPPTCSPADASWVLQADGRTAVVTYNGQAPQCQVAYGVYDTHGFANLQVPGAFQSLFGYRSAVVGAGNRTATLTVPEYTADVSCFAQHDVTLTEIGTPLAPIYPQRLDSTNQDKMSEVLVDPARTTGTQKCEPTVWRDLFLPAVFRSDPVVPEPRVCKDARILVNGQAQGNIGPVNLGGVTTYDAVWTRTGGAEVPTSVYWKITLVNPAGKITEVIRALYRAGTNPPWAGWTPVADPTHLEINYLQEVGWDAAAGADATVTTYPFYGVNVDLCPQAAVIHHIDPPVGAAAAKIVAEGKATWEQVVRTWKAEIKAGTASRAVLEAVEQFEANSRAYIERANLELSN